MPKALDRLNQKPKPKNNEADGTVTMRVSPPQVKVGAPVVNVKVAEPQLNMDSSQFANAINDLAKAMKQLADQQQMLLQVINDHHAVINSALARQPNIEVAAPKVTIPARPREFDVAFVEDDDGEVVGMSVRAKNLPN